MLNGINSFSNFQNEVGFLYLSRFIIYIVFTFAIIMNKEQNFKRILIKSIWIFILCTLLFSILQFSLYPNLRNLRYLGWDPHHHRLFGMFLDTTIMGILLCVSFFWILMQSINRKTKLLLLGLTILLLFLTYSRITYIVFILTFLVFYIKKIQLKRLILFFSGFLLVLFILPRPQGESVNLLRLFTIQARVENNKEAISLFTKKPLIGYGYDRLRYIRETEPQSHSGGAFSSTYLTLLVAGGIIGLVVYLFWLYQLMLLVGLEGKIIILVMTASSIFDNILLVNFILVLLPLLLRSGKINYRLNNSQ
jgi:hypothetical protein